MKIYTYIGVVLLSLASLLQADVLVQYDFEGETLVASSQDANITASDFSAVGDGAVGYLTGSGGTGTKAYKKNDWANASDDNPNDYFAFSITVAQGYIVDLTGLSFATQRSGTGPTNWVVKYSTDDSTYYEIEAGNDAVADAFHTHNADLLLPFDVTGTLYFRIYGTNSSDAAGSWRIDDVTLNGSISVDTGRRVIKYQGFDGSQFDNWTHVTNAGTAVVVATNEQSYSGGYSERLAGITSGSATPALTFDNIDISTDDSLRISLAFAAKDTVSGDDLFLDVSYDNGSSWSQTRLVDGYGGTGIAFGTTHASNPTTVDSNPYTLNLSSSASQVKIRVRYADGSGVDNSARYYYVDAIKLDGIVEPSVASPLVALQDVGNIGTTSAVVKVHLKGGYPYPTVKLFWGPVDGGTDAGAWNNSKSLGSQNWGMVTNTLTGLQSGQIYYLRVYAENSQGSDWSDSSTNFVTTASALSSLHALYVDSLGVSTGVPLCIDLDGNNIADSWEEKYLGGSGQNPAGDADNDGVSNLRESWAGTDPSDSNSYLHILTMDLPAVDSSNIRIQWRGGGSSGPTNFAPVGDSIQRKFRIYATDDPSVGKTLVASISDGLSGTNSWVDTNAVSATSHRYYELAVATGDGSYTNVEEWAMHVQPRVSGKSYIICVPVDYGSASNNLNSTLGTQLARGLYASDTEAQADKIRWIDSSANWVQYFLSATYGWTADGTGAADVSMTPGQALWVVRGSGSANRPNAVFTGKSFTSSTVTNFTFSKTDAGGWTMFGWPLPKPRRHLGSSTATNQLGFAAVGTGGKVGIPSDSRSGDELWVWDGSHWDWFWLVDLHNGANTANGRWWKGDGNDFGDIDLEVGKGYYYLHTTNWSSSDFEWTPKEP